MDSDFATEGQVVGEQFYTHPGDTYEDSYTEIPPPLPVEGSHITKPLDGHHAGLPVPPPPPEGFSHQDIPDLKGLEYKTKFSTGALLTDKSHDLRLDNHEDVRKCKENASNSYNGNVIREKETSGDGSYYSEIRNPLQLCRRQGRQGTIHVLVLALMGLAYLIIGGLAGYWIGRACKFGSLLQYFKLNIMNMLEFMHHMLFQLSADLLFLKRLYFQLKTYISKTAAFLNAKKSE